MFGKGAIFGVVHLAPLPGSPGYGGRMAPVIARAAKDAQAYAAGGAAGVVVENYGDAPFFAGALPPETVAALTLCARAVRDAIPLPVGVNALRNDARAGLGIAAAVGAAFLRINVHAGVVATDQGLLEGRAAETVRTRAALCPDVRIAADVHVKHGRPLSSTGIVQSALDLAHRAHADALILTGPGTGLALDLAELTAVRAALPDFPLLAGSGVTPQNVAAILDHADAVIVGTSAKRGGRTAAPVDARRVEKLVRAARN